MFFDPLDEIQAVSLNGGIISTEINVDDYALMSSDSIHTHLHVQAHAHGADNIALKDMANALTHSNALQENEIRLKGLTSNDFTSFIVSSPAGVSRQVHTKTDLRRAIALLNGQSEIAKTSFEALVPRMIQQSVVRQGVLNHTLPPDLGGLNIQFIE